MNVLQIFLRMNRLTIMSGWQWTTQ